MIGLDSDYLCCAAVLLSDARIIFLYPNLLVELVCWLSGGPGGESMQVKSG